MTTTNDPTPDDPAPEAIPGELLWAGPTPIVPLLNAVRGRVRQTVKLHLPGMGVAGQALEVEGRLVNVDEDDMTVTIVDGDTEYDIPLHRIAIIEADR